MFYTLGKAMLKDHNHDLVHQLSETSDSFWRIEDYIKNAEGCDYCKGIWEEMKSDFEKHVEMLRVEIERHVKEGRFK